MNGDDADGELVWDEARLRQLLVELRERGGDTTNVEVKSAAGGVTDVARTLCAFANMPDGGTLICGLTEPGFAPVGLADVAGLEAALADKARTVVKPPVGCTFSTIRLGEHDVLICEVQGLLLHDRPAKVSGRAYLRFSDGDYVMSDQEIRQIDLMKLQDSTRIHHDREAVPGAQRDDLDDALTTSFLRTVKSASPKMARLDDDEVLRWTNVMTDKGELTVGGCYALAQYPQRFLPSLAVTAAVQLPPGSPLGRTRDLAHFDGPLPEILESTMDWVRRNTSSTIRYTESGHARNEYDMPLDAVREIVTNALVHRNLAPITDSKRVEVRINDGRLTITSPGGLWGVSVSQLGTPTGRSAVNKYLYEICKHVRLSDGNRLIEGEGGGIREAMRAMADAGLREPRFIDSGVRFDAVLWTHSLLTTEELTWLDSLPETKGLSSVQKAILVALRAGDAYSDAEIRHEFGPLDSREAHRLLQELVDTGLVRMEGTRGNARYLLRETQRKESLNAGAQLPTDRAELILALVPTHATTGALMKATGLSRSMVRTTLEKLRTEGRITLVSSSLRNAHYIVNQ